jgi:hypothetical protein
MENNQPPIAQTPIPYSQVPPMPPVPAKKGSSKMIVATVILIVAILVIAAVAITMINTMGNVKSKAADMTFKKADFPTGWHASTTTVDSPEGVNVDWSYSVFNNSVTGSFTESMSEVSCQLYIYSSVSAAKADFNDLLEEENTMTLTEVSGHFDQCRVWVMGSSTIVNAKMYVYQEKNVCGIISFTSVGGNLPDQAWIDQMLDLQESRIA